MSQIEKQTLPAECDVTEAFVKQTDRGSREIWWIYLKAGLVSMAVALFLTACNDSERQSNWSNFKSTQLPPQTPTHLTTTPQETASPSPTEEKPKLDPTAVPTSTPENNDLSDQNNSPETESSEDSSDEENSNPEDYRDRKVKLSEYERLAMNAVKTGSKLKITGVANNIDDCKEEGCFEVPFEVSEGLGNLSYVAEGRLVAGHKPKFYLSDEPGESGEGTNTVLWPDTESDQEEESINGEVIFGIHNRSEFPWMTDSAWADLESLKEGHVITIIDEEGERFEFVLVRRDIISKVDEKGEVWESASDGPDGTPRKGDFVRVLVFPTTEDHGGRRLFIYGCTHGGSDSDNLLGLTFVPLDREVFQPDDPNVESSAALEALLIKQFYQ